MSLTDMRRRELASLMDKEANLKKDLQRHETDAAKAKEGARRYEEQAQRASSASSTKSAHSSAGRETDKALQASKKAGEVVKKLGDNARAQANCRRSLQSAEKSDQQAQDRDADRRRQREKDHAREIARLAAPTIHYVHIRQPAPEKLRVLYLTANPALDLRTEVEVRQVQQALRGAKYRDLITIEQRPAATFQDLLDGLNDVRPHVIHFSGHGGAETLVMENGSGEDGAEHSVSFTLLVKALAATDSPPTLLVLNACDTTGGAEIILPAVPVVIAMSDNVPDTAAIIFAQQFYAALASSQSVASALNQAKVAIEAATLNPTAAELPECLFRNDVDIGTLVLVAGSN